MKSSINCLLIGLASFDLLLIITSILMFGLPSIYTHSLVTGSVEQQNNNYNTQEIAGETPSWHSTLRRYSHTSHHSSFR